MSALTPSWLAVRIAQRHADTTLVDTCTVLNSAAPRATVATATPCFVGALGNPFTIGGGADRPVISAQWVIHLLAGLDVQPDYHIALSPSTTTPGLRGRTFSVVGDAPGSNEILRVVYAAEAQ